MISTANARTVRLIVGTCLVASIGSDAIAWNMSGGGAWDVPNARRVVWNPTNGNLGNMGNAGVTYSVGAAPGAAQAGAVAAAEASYSPWNNLASSKVRINFKKVNAGAKVPLTWENLPADDQPGVTTNAATNFNPRLIKLHSGNVLRTDGWNLDFGGTRPDTIDEVDIYTTAVHEVGHAVGLGHPAANNKVMTPQNQSRQEADGLFRGIEQTTPFVGQPQNLAGGALPNGARAYFDPRASLTDDDAVGAVTLYSAPMIDISGSNLVTTEGVESRYTITNDSAQVGGTRADYLVRQVSIPVDAVVPVDSLFAPAGWTITRNANDVTVTADTAAAALIPGQQLEIFFIGRVYEVTNVEPSNRWRSNKYSQPNSGIAAPFTVTDWAVDNGRKDYIYNGNTDKWDFRQLPLVPSPIPTPGAGALALLGFAAASRRAR